MASGVAAVWVPVDDMTRAVAFYRDTLGLSVRDEGDDWSELTIDGLTVGLNAREDTHDGHGGGAVITFTPDAGLEAEVERLEGEGVQFAGGISEHPWGRLVTFTDPDGNDLQLYAPPA